MAVYNIIRTTTDNATVCKDGVCYADLTISSLDNTIRAINWNGTTGVTELCNGTDYDTNTGEGTLSSESDFQVCIDAWQAAYDAEQQAIAGAEAEQQEEETPSEE